MEVEEGYKRRREDHLYITPKRSSFLKIRLSREELQLVQEDAKNLGLQMLTMLGVSYCNKLPEKGVSRSCIGGRMRKTKHTCVECCKTLEITLADD